VTAPTPTATRGAPAPLVLRAGALALLAALGCMTALLTLNLSRSPVPLSHALLNGLLAVTLGLFALYALRWPLTVLLAAGLVAAAMLLPNRISSALTPGGGDGPVDIIALLALVVGGLVIAERAWRRRLRWQRTGVEWPAAAMLTLALLTTVLRGGETPWVGPIIRGYVMVFLPLLMLPLWANAGWDHRQAERALLCLVACGAVMAALGLMVAFTFWKLMGSAGVALFGVLSESLARAKSPLGGSGPTGLALTMLLPLALVHFLHARRAATVAWGLLAALLTAGILLSVSRTVVAMTPLLLALTLWWCRERVRARATGLLVLGLLCATATGIAGYHYARQSASISRLQQMRITESGSDRMRVAALRLGLDMAGAHPVLGTGLGRWYPRDTGTVLIPIQGEQTVRNPHNLYIQALAEQGVLGGTLYLAVLVIPLVALLGMRRRARSPLLQDRLVAVAVAVVALLLYSLTSSSVSVMPRLGVVYWSYLGFGYACFRAEQNEEQRGYGIG